MQAIKLTYGVSSLLSTDKVAGHSGGESSERDKVIQKLYFRNHVKNVKCHLPQEVNIIVEST